MKVDGWMNGKILGRRRKEQEMANERGKMISVQAPNDLIRSYRVRRPYEIIKQ